jgi:hypothetical protein
VVVLAKKPDGHLSFICDQMVCFKGIDSRDFEVCILVDQKMRHENKIYKADEHAYATVHFKQHDNKINFDVFFETESHTLTVLFPT